MESNVQRRAAGLRAKLPEMQSTLSTIGFLRQQRERHRHRHRQDNDNGNDSKSDDDNDDDDNPSSPAYLQTSFSLSDTLYAKAHIPLTSSTSHPSSENSSSSSPPVYLWLGANVMVSYPAAEAESMLSSRVAKAVEALAACDEDAGFLREQITTVEVAVARVHNWDVGEKRRRKVRGDGMGGGD
jgi:Prefoldin subunit